MAARPERWGADAAMQVAQFARAVGERPASLAATLAWLDAERAHVDQLEQAAVSDADSVKLLTVHKAKGLEWEAVFLPQLAAGVFPSDRVSDSPVHSAERLAGELRGDAESVPQLRELSRAGFAAYAGELAERQRCSEDRLAYVAASRAKRLLIGTTAYWRAGRAKAVPPSRVFDALAGSATGPVDVPEPLPENPTPSPDPDGVGWWPAVDEQQAALDAWAAEAVAVGLPDPPDPKLAPLVVGELSVEDAAALAGWQADAARLLAAEAGRRGPRELVLPTSLTASAVLAGIRDPAALALDLARPMPRPISAGATLGSRFHQWVEDRFHLVERPLDESGEADTPTPEPDPAGPGAGQDLGALIAAFESGPYAGRAPLRVEVPFQLRLAGRQLRGRIDAVYEGGGPGSPAGARYQIVDWKTSTRTPPDPNQLAIYRAAWARAAGCDQAEVDAVFYIVPTGEIVRPELPAEADLERLVRSLGGN
jgi:DNA helicase-2/ATP-dependent DNA helicase PcrA